MQPAAMGARVRRLTGRASGARGNRLLKLPVVLAGGLNPENVTEAIAAARPAAVDVASGVEVAPRKKDAAKSWAFVAAAKQASTGA